MHLVRSTLGIALAAWAIASLIYMIPVLPATCAALRIIAAACAGDRLTKIYGA